MAAMTTTTPSPAGRSEGAILARLLGNGTARLTPFMARYVLRLGFNDQDKARMHELAERNQEDLISPAERDELLAYVKAGDLLGILQSKARRSLRSNTARRKSS
jgi:hypothetical protein